MVNLFGEKIPLRTGVIKSERGYGDFARIEEPDGTLHVWSPRRLHDVHVVVMPDGGHAVAFRGVLQSRLASLLEPQARPASALAAKMVTARLGGARLYVLPGGFFHFCARRKTVPQVERVKVPIPPRDGVHYETPPVAGVRLIIRDRMLLLTQRAGEALQ